MTREEAIKWLRLLRKTPITWDDYSEETINIRSAAEVKEREAIYMAIKALKEQDWIPCSERLPNEEERQEAYLRSDHASEFIVMIKGGTRPTTLLLTHDDQWMDENRMCYKVLAWMPLPTPYKGGDTE